MQDPAPILAQPLTAEAFAPFGQLIALPKGGGRPSDFGAQVRFDHTGTLENRRSDAAKPNLAVVQVAASVGPYRIDMMERHEYSSQAFIALDVARFLTIVAPNLPDGAPDIANLRAFVGGPGQGINYKAGTWHFPLIALERAGVFSLLMWEDGSTDDCGIVAIENGPSVIAPPPGGVA
jgi:ureidoglycolate lyase